MPRRVRDLRAVTDPRPRAGLIARPDDRFDGPLIVANAKTFRSEVRQFARSHPPPRWIVIACKPMTDVDTTAADMLEALDQELEEAGIHLAFAEMKDAVRQKIRAYGVEWLEDHDAFHPTVGAAVRAYREAAGIPKPDHHPAS